MIHLFRLNLKQRSHKCIGLVPLMVSAFKLATDNLDDMLNNYCGADVRNMLWGQLGTLIFSFEFHFLNFS